MGAGGLVGAPYQATEVPANGLLATENRGAIGVGGFNPSGNQDGEEGKGDSEGDEGVHGFSLPH